MMKIEIFEDHFSWFEARRGKITGSRLGDVYSARGNKKKGFYEVIAERLGLSADDENPADRGTRLEGEALDEFEKATGKKLNRDKALWMRSDNESIAISPDASVVVDDPTVIAPFEAVECKCLSSANHLEALLTGKIPDDYKYQRLQYFIVNEDLKELHFAFYDPRVLAKPFFIITTKREDVEADIIQFLAFERDTLTEIDLIVNKLSNF